MTKDEIATVAYERFGIVADDDEIFEFSQWILNEVAKPKSEPFAVKFYIGDEYPSIKGNGFDGLGLICDDREDADRFVAFINERITL